MATSTAARGDTLPAPSRLTGVEPARRRHGARAERFVRFYWMGDPLADAAVRSLAGIEHKEQARLVDSVLGAEPDPAAPEALCELGAAIRSAPVWVNFERCDRGAAAFMRAGPMGGVALAFSSLAGAYCSAGGVKPLMFTGQLVANTYARLLDTGKFIWEVSQPGAVAPGGAGLRALTHVRLVHARIRARLERDPRWQADAWGTPINQADMAGTALCFSWKLIDGIRVLGGRFDADEAADWLHLWRYAGHVLGLDPELSFGTEQEARELAELILLIDGGPDADSKKLIEALFAPAVFEAKTPQPAVAYALRRLEQAFCRRFLGDELADAVAIPRQPVIDSLATVLPKVNWWAQRGLARLPQSERILQAAGRWYWKDLLELH